MRAVCTKTFENKSELNSQICFNKNRNQQILKMPKQNRYVKNIP